MLLIAELPDESIVQTELPAGRPVTVGRGLGSEIVIADSAMSNVHFRIAVNGGNGWLKDLSSWNGTYVNGSRVSDAAIGPGDLIQAGNSRIRLGFAAADA